MTFTAADTTPIKTKEMNQRVAWSESGSQKLAWIGVFELLAQAWKASAQALWMLDKHFIKNQYGLLSHKRSGVAQHCSDVGGEIAREVWRHDVRK